MPNYTRKHYETFARLIGEAIRKEDTATQLGLDIARLFASDNERFDRSRFEARVDQYVKEEK